MEARTASLRWPSFKTILFLLAISEATHLKGTNRLSKSSPFEAETVPVDLWTALKFGTAQLWDRITGSLSGLWHLAIGGISSCNLSGPVAIAQTSGSLAQQGTESFVLFIGILSAAVGLLNLMPIPVLDGGHLVFHAYEAVTRRKPTEFALKVLMSGGIAIIGSLMIYALLNDLILCP